MMASDRVKAHLERHLGPLVRVTEGHRSEDGRDSVCLIATFADQPAEGALTLVTVGLSEVPFEGPEGEEIRQELMVSAWDDQLDDRLYNLLFSTAQALVDDGEPASPGDLLELDGALADGSEIRHVFVYPPTYLPEELEAVPATEDAGEIELLWLIPVTASEVQKIEEDGPEAFEMYLAGNDPDLLDLGRG